MSFTLLPFVLVIAGYAGFQVFLGLRRKARLRLAGGLLVLALMAVLTWMIFTANPNY